MRSLQECQAEVFRRGNEKIRQRRRKIQKCRNWAVGIALCCVPIVACLTLLSGGLKKENMTIYEYKQEAALEMEQTYPGSGFSVTAVQVHGPEGNYTLTNTDDIVYLMSLMERGSFHIADDSFIGKAEQEPESAPEADGNSGATMDANEDADENWYRYQFKETNTGYKLNLVMADGTVSRYFLIDNTIIDLQTGQVTILSQEQSEDLRAFLEGKVVTE